MNFNQGELDLSGNGSVEGHRKWLRELDEKKRAFELRHGVVIGRRVRVQLIGETHPLEGMIHIISPNTAQTTTKLKLSMGMREFTPLDIESIVRLENDPTPPDSQI